MNREIKFRAWSNGIKSDSVVHRRKFGEWIFPPQMMYDEKPGDCLVWKSQGQNIEVMQYTGLKDRNGKEIYEGDLAKHIEFESEDGPYNEEIGIVKWEDGTHFVETVVGSCITKWLIANGKNTEVIGNIYENSDLLPKAIESTAKAGE